MAGATAAHRGAAASLRRYRIPSGCDTRSARLPSARRAGLINGRRRCCRARSESALLKNGCSHGDLRGVTRPGIPPIFLCYNSILLVDKVGAPHLMILARLRKLAMPSKTAERLISLRGKRPQSEIAKVAGVSPGSVSNWENGIHSPPLDAAAKLAEHWQVTTDYLAGLTDHPSALPPDSWVVDLDFVEAIQRRDGSHRKIGAEGAFAIPRRPAIASSTEYQALQRELEQGGLVKRQRNSERKS